MFGRKPRIPIDFSYPTVRADEHQPNMTARSVDEWLAAIRSRGREAMIEAKRQTELEAQRQKRYYDRGRSCVAIHTGDTVLMLQKAFTGKKKVPDKWLSEPFEVVEHLDNGQSPLFRVRDTKGKTQVVHRNRLLLFEPYLQDNHSLDIPERTISIFTVVPAWQTHFSLNGDSVEKLIEDSPVFSNSFVVQDGVVTTSASDRIDPETMHRTVGRMDTLGYTVTALAVFLALVVAFGWDRG